MCRNAARLQKREIARAVDGLDRVGLQVRLVELASCRKCHAARVVPHCLNVRDLVARIRQGKDRLGGTELRVSEVGAALTGCTMAMPRATSSGIRPRSFSAAAITVGPSPDICAE